MTFMLGAFTQGLSEGAKDIYGLSDMAAQTDQRKAQTESLRQETSMKQQAFDAGKLLSNAATAPQATPMPAVNTTPSDSGTTGGGVGTTTNGPVAPTTFENLPAPANMQGVTTGGMPAGPQSTPGTPGGFGPSYNPEAGPVNAAQVGQGAVPTNVPGAVQAPTMASSDTRAAPTLGGAVQPQVFPGGTGGAVPATTPSAPATPQQVADYRAQRQAQLPPVAGGTNTTPYGSNAPQVYAGGSGAAGATPQPSSTAPASAIPVPPSHSGGETVLGQVLDAAHRRTQTTSVSNTPRPTSFTNDTQITNQPVGATISEGLRNLPTPAAPGPNMGLVTNRPVGSAMGDLVHGKKSPDQTADKPKSKPQRTSSTDNIGRHLAGALNIG